MELRHYWQILGRRTGVIRNTMIVVVLLSVASVAYAFYGAQYKGAAVFSVQMLQGKLSPSAVIDPQAAANGNSGPVLSDLSTYAGQFDYFKAISRVLSRAPYRLNVPYKTIAQSLKVFRSNDGNSMNVEWYDSSQSKAEMIVAAATTVLRSYVGPLHAQKYPTAPKIVAPLIQRADAERQSFTKPVTDILLRVAAGLAVAVVLAFLFEYLDDTMHDESDVAQWLGVPTLSVIPSGRKALKARTT